MAHFIELKPIEITNTHTQGETSERLLTCGFWGEIMMHIVRIRNN